jgi:chromosome segregation ATPase
MNLPNEDRQLLPMLDNNILQLIEVKNQVIKNLEEKYKDAHHQRGQAEGRLQNLQINFNKLTDRNADHLQELTNTKKELQDKKGTIKNLEEEIKVLKKLDVSIINEQIKKLTEENKKLIQEKEQYKKSYDESQKELQKMIDKEERKTRNKKIKEYIKNNGNDEGYISFDGDDYCEDCPGWDGFSHRCECGNRRMDWYDEDGDFYPEPY